MGPQDLIIKMRGINSHIGSWAPMAEKKATARFLSNEVEVDAYLTHFKSEVEYRLNNLYNGFIQLKKEGFSIEVIEPKAAIYLSVQIDLKGKKTSSGIVLDSQERVTDYILSEAKLAIVPFSSFGYDKESSWYRVSVGCCKKEEIDTVISKLRAALQQLS
jgi:aspartate aminotransferase